MAKRALITGVTGQDGAYLAKLLVEKGYIVHGGVRDRVGSDRSRLHDMGVADAVELHSLDLSDRLNIQQLLDTTAPDEIYNLAAQSSVARSFQDPIQTADIGGLGVMRLLETLRESGSMARFYQASSSEMFGQALESPQTERTPFYPRSPYGVSKLFGHWATVNYREAHGLFSVSGILFNHESPLRGADYVTRKITIGLAKIANGQQDFLELGNLDARRDWGFAGDYVEGMWRMLQTDAPENYVLATGVPRTVRHFVEVAAAALGMRMAWKGEGREEIGIDETSGKIIVAVNPKFFRPTEVEVVVGDPSKAERELGWRRSIDFPTLVSMMVEADARRIRDGDLRPI